MAIEVKCQTCKHCGCDPDGLYCGHPEAINLSVYGLSLNAATVDNSYKQGSPSICGQERKLYEVASTESLKFRGFL